MSPRTDGAGISIRMRGTRARARRNRRNMKGRWEVSQMSVFLVVAVAAMCHGEVRYLSRSVSVHHTYVQRDAVEENPSKMKSKIREEREEKREEKKKYFPLFSILLDSYSQLYHQDIQGRNLPPPFLSLRDAKSIPVVNKRNPSSYYAQYKANCPILYSCLLKHG